MDGLNIVHIDRNQLFREGLRRILDGSSYNIAHGISSVAEGIAQILTHQPGMVIIDTAGYGDVLVELMLSIRGVPTPPRVVILTDAVGIPRLASALSAGVDGYLLKDMSSEALKQSLNLVVMGEKVFPTDLAHLLINSRHIGQNEKVADRPGQLSDRESEILACLVNGQSNKVIASQLRITEGTVKVHLKGVLKKIHVTNRTQAAIWALQNGVIAAAHAVAQGVHSAIPLQPPPVASGLAPPVERAPLSCGRVGRPAASSAIAARTSVLSR
ncbi:MAG: LuxR C-terminal-related transcriptional regulator [Ferrovibrio sp.]